MCRKCIMLSVFEWHVILFDSFTSYKLINGFVLKRSFLVYCDSFICMFPKTKHFLLFSYSSILAYISIYEKNHQNFCRQLHILPIYIWNTSKLYNSLYWNMVIILTYFKLIHLELYSRQDVQNSLLHKFSFTRR